LHHIYINPVTVDFYPDRLDQPTLSTYHHEMDQEIQGLGEQIERLLAITRRLGDENAQLKAQLTAAQSVNENMKQKMFEARARVESALSRLPLVSDEA
jgi:predicted  nucleic acid-binding Zn-ribbon protein